MTLEEARDRLVKSVGQQSAVNAIVMASQVNGEYRFAHANVSPNVVTDFTSDVKAFIRASVAGARLRPYEPAYKPDDDELLYLELARASDLKSYTDPVAKPSGLPVFDDSKGFVDGLRFTVANYRTPGGNASLFRRYSPSKELTRSRFRSVVFEGGTFNKFKKKVFLFDDHFDCVEYEGFLLIKSVGNFEWIFGYVAQLHALAQDVIKDIRGAVPIAGFAEFEAACLKQPQMTAKLASLAGRGYITSLNLEKCKEIIKQFDLPIEVVSEHGIEKLQFDPAPERRWLILKVLDDDFLNSDLTNARYESNSKVPR